MSAEQAWDDDGSLRRWLNRPEELLLAELGRAVRIYPELAARTAYRPSVAGSTWTPTAPTTSCPPRHPCSMKRASACCCRRGGTGAASSGLAVSASTPVDGVVETARRFGRDQLIDFRWELAVGDDTLTEDEINALVADQGPADPAARTMGGGGSRATAPRIGVPQSQPHRAGQHRAEILALAASQPADTPLEITAVRADGWLGDLLSGAAAQSLQPLQPPPGFAATLRPYQQRGLSWLAFLSSLGLGSCLADDMGLGKTVQLLALESAQRHDRPRHRTDPADLPDVTGRQLAT